MIRFPDKLWPFVVWTVRLLLLLTGFFLYRSCRTTKAVPDEQLAIRPSIVNLFDLLYRDNLLVFENGKGQTMIFSMGEIDSTIHNTKGGFINSGPNKVVRFEIRKLYPYRFQAMRGQIFMAKSAIRVSDTSSVMHIQWEGFQYGIYDTIPPVQQDSLALNQKVFTGYSVLHTKTMATIRDEHDITDIFFTNTDGIVAFRTYNAEYWTLRK